MKFQYVHYNMGRAACFRTQKGDFSQDQELCLKELADKLRVQKKEERLRIRMGRSGNRD